jgi:hypothetical protein
MRTVLIQGVRMTRFRSALICSLVPLLLAGCAPAGGDEARVARLEKEVAELRAHVEHERSEGAGKAVAASAAEGPELGAQMLELQIRHARLWQAGAARNWILAQFQLAELRETVSGIVETNGDHAALQPQRLADVMPAMLDPALGAMQSAVDGHDGAAFDAAYDQLSQACTGCHAASDHGFLVIQRPLTPVLDNLRAEAQPVGP